MKWENLCFYAWRWRLLYSMADTGGCFGGRVIALCSPRLDTLRRYGRSALRLRNMPVTSRQQ